MLQVSILVEPLPGSLRANAPDKSILVFDAISKRALRPASLGIVSLIFKSRAVDVVVFVIRKVELSIERTHAFRIAVQIHIVVAVKIIEASEVMLPARRPRHGEFHAAQQAVELRPFVGIGRQRLHHAVHVYERIVTVEAPFARNAGMTVRVSHVHAQRSFVVYRNANVCSLQRVRICIVDSRPVGIKLIAKKIVVEAPPSSGD